MILRLLIAAIVLLFIAKFYLEDSESPQTVKPKQHIEQVQSQIDDISKEAEEKRKKALENMGI